MEYDTSYPPEGTTKNQFNIWIEWNKQKMPWNEICAKVIEVFGLPGNKYVSSPTTHYMLFRFKTEKDYLLCKILLSEYIV